MKSTRSTRRDASRPSDRVNPRPPKAARTNEPESSTNKSDTEETSAPFPMNSPATPVPSSGMQDVMKMVNDLLEKEREEMKSYIESSLKSFQERMRLEMQQGMDELQKRHEAEIKALKEAMISQGQVLEALKKEVATLSKGNESRRLDDQIQPVGNSSADDGTTQSRASVSALPNSEENQDVAPSRPKSLVTWKGTRLYMDAPEGWEPPECTSKMPEKDELWPSRRGSKISRHPLADGIHEGYQSAIERAMQKYNDGAKDGAKDGL